MFEFSSSSSVRTFIHSSHVVCSESIWEMDRQTFATKCVNDFVAQLKTRAIRRESKGTKQEKRHEREESPLDIFDYPPAPMFLFPNLYENDMKGQEREATSVTRAPNKLLLGALPYFIPRSSRPAAVQRANGLVGLSTWCRNWWLQQENKNKKKISSIPIRLSSYAV